MSEKRTLLDFKGEETGVPFKKSMLIAVVAAVLAVIIGSRLPLAHYGEKAGLALGFFTAILILFLSRCFAVEAVGMILVVGGFFLGIWDWSTFQASTATSSFLQMFSMMVVAAGANTTPIGRRIALWALKKIGNKPIRLVLGFGIVTAFISSFISNVATLILMSGIAHSMLVTMEEKPGESKLGRVLFLLIPALSFLGGMGLINGSPGSNVFGLGILSSFTGGKYIVSFGQFATIMYPTMLIILIPFIFIYIKTLGLKNSDVNQKLSADYFDSLYKELGAMTGSEIRWVILLAGMVAWLLAGGHGTAVPLTIAAICLLPVLGTTPASKVWQSVPMTILFIMYMVSPMGLLWSSTGLMDAVSDLLGGMVNFPPLVLCILLTFLNLLMCNVLVNAGAMVSFPVLMGIGIGICETMGVNPGLILLPVIVTGSCHWMVVINVASFANFGYGYYRIKDAVLPGFLVILLASIVIPVLVFLLVPIAGVPIYL
jgi:sodium-dependent dicarboxylate transporter 2/3/5